MRHKQTEEKKKSIINEGVIYEHGTEITNYPGYKSFIRHQSVSLMSYYLSAFAVKSPAIVFDFQFDHLCRYEKYLRSLILQMITAYGDNLKYRDPFRMFFANFKKDSKFSNGLQNRNIDLDKHIIIESEKSYLDLFPKNKLVYLSPHADVEMKEVDEDKVYIIGVLADIGSDNNHHTYHTAKKEGIKCERLPIDSYAK